MTRMMFETERWQTRLDELRTTYRVPGASIAMLVGGEVYELASGVAHLGTGVRVTPDTVFQLGSLTKVYTATAVMRLVDDGRFDLDTRMVEVLPDFRTVDAKASEEITIRQLLSHTSGMTGDFFYDGGRGDDALRRYLEAASSVVGQDFPPGAMSSYCSTGYDVLGRMIEVVTGQAWDDAMRDLVFEPLGLGQTMTLPEDVLRFRSAMGHLGVGSGVIGPVAGGNEPEVAPTWSYLTRSAGPYGGVLATAADVLRFARMHLDGGVGEDGTRVLSGESVSTMRERQASIPDGYVGTHWGLGWSLFDWEGGQLCGHDGSTVTQLAYLRVVPEAGLAVVLLTNSSVGGDPMYDALVREFLVETAGVRMPDFGPGPVDLEVDTEPFLGTYRREGARMTVTDAGLGRMHLRHEFLDGLAGIAPALELELAPISESRFATRRVGEEGWGMPVAFSWLPDGRRHLYYGARATPADSGVA